MTTEKKFSFVYSQIVEGENDMIGHITYSLYKTSKIKFIETFKQGHEGRLPTEEELEAFHITAQNHIPSYRIQAEQLLSDFISISLDKNIEEIEKQMLSNYNETLESIVAPLIPPPSKGPWSGFWMAVIVKGMQTLIVAIIIFFIIFAASAKENGLWNAITRLFPKHEEVNSMTTDSITTKVTDSTTTKVIKSASDKNNHN